MVVISVIFTALIGFSILIQPSPSLAVTLCVVFSFLLISITYTFIIHRIEYINKKISKTYQNQSTDEITAIENKAEKMADLIEKLNAELDTQKEQHKKHIQQITSEHHAKEKPAQKTHEEVMHLTNYDTSTSLPNRIFFNEILNKSIKHASRHNKLLAVLIIHLDSFNESRHANLTTSDAIINTVSKSLRETLRTDDILARFDNDEFIVLLNDIGKSKFASTVANKILAALEKNFTIDSEEFSVKTSIGICIFPNDGTSLEELITNTINAAFQAKKEGGNCYQFYTHQMDKEAREYTKVANALRSAIERNELALYYQPKLHIKNGNIAGVEALIRWVHPELGVLTPAQFIPIAEETGMIIPIGEWALREACRMNKYWQDEGYEHLTVAVNLSAKQFFHPEIVQKIKTILNDTQLKPNYLEIEVSETAIMNDINSSTNILQKIKATGIQISIDHFGTGYTSIMYLKKLPLSMIKIDQAFIKGLPNNPDDLAITNAIISLAHNLGFNVVAEGVESAEQVQYLADHQCDMVQGYFLSHPVSAEKIMLQFKKLMDEIVF